MKPDELLLVWESPITIELKYGQGNYVTVVAIPFLTTHFYVQVAYKVHHYYSYHNELTTELG